MAMNVNFLKGLYSKYVGLASKDSNTFYLTYESGTNEAMSGAIRLFLGAEELTNKVDIAALREYIGTLPEGATSEDVVSYISEAITAKIGTLKIGDTSYDTVVDYVIAKTTGIATDSVVQGKADKVAPAKVNNIAVLTTDGNLSDGGKTIAEVEQDAKEYTDAEITGLEFALSEDGKTLNLNNKIGTTVATLDTTKFVKDGMISSVVISDDGTKLIITWNTDAGISATEIPLTELVDVMEGVDGTTITVSVSEDDKISAEIKNGSITASHLAANANILKSQLESDVQISLTKANTAMQPVSGATQYNLACFDANGNVADSAMSTAEVSGTIAWKAQVIAGLSTVPKANYAAEADSATEADSASNALAFDGKSVENFVQTTGDQTIGGVKTFSDEFKVQLNSEGIPHLKVSQYEIQLSVGAGADAIGLDVEGAFFRKDGHTLRLPSTAGTLTTEAYVKDTYIGNTNATVEDVVKAVNKLSTGAENASTAIGAINNNVDAITEQLTWGSF